MKQCPVCQSWETQRHTQGFQVWFTCRRCGHTFA